jgi:hypothetical protein
MFRKKNHRYLKCSCKTYIIIIIEVQPLALLLHHASQDLLQVARHDGGLEEGIPQAVRGDLVGCGDKLDVLVQQAVDEVEGRRGERVADGRVHLRVVARIVTVVQLVEGFS